MPEQSGVGRRPSAGFGSCDACGNPLSDREMFHGDVCDRCSEYESDQADEMACPMAGGIPCVSEDCLRNGCIEEREP